MRLRMPNTKRGLLGVAAIAAAPFTWFAMYLLINGSAPDWYNSFMVSTGSPPLQGGPGMQLSQIPPGAQPEAVALLAALAVFMFILVTLMFWVMLLIVPGAHRADVGDR